MSGRNGKSQSDLEGRCFVNGLIVYVDSDHPAGDSAMPTAQASPVSLFIFQDLSLGKY